MSLKYSEFILAFQLQFGTYEAESEQKTVGSLFNFLVAFETNQGVTLSGQDRLAGLTRANLETFLKVSTIIINFDKCKSVRRC